MDIPSTSEKRECLVVNRGDPKPCTREDTGTRGAVEKAVESKGDQNLKEEESERESDPALEWGCDLFSTVGDMNVGRTE